MPVCKVTWLSRQFESFLLARGNIKFNFMELEFSFTFIQSDSVSLVEIYDEFTVCSQKLLITDL